MARITKKEALEIARAECSRLGITWNDHTFVKWGLFTYTAWGGGRRGANLIMKIRKSDGTVLSTTMSPK